RNSQKNKRKNETRRAAKQHVEKTGNQKRDSDRRLHAPVSLARNPASNNRTDSRSDTARREEHTDTAGRILTNWENTFTKHSEQRQYAAADAPRGFHQQRREHAWPILNVLNALDRLSDPQ